MAGHQLRPASAVRAYLTGITFTCSCGSFSSDVRHGPLLAAQFRRHLQRVHRAAAVRL